MLKKKKCPACNKKIKESFSYCPNCGNPSDNLKDPQDFGMIGKNDFASNINEELKLPFGLGKMVNSLVKQLEQQMNAQDFENSGVPKGFKIKVSAGPPRANQMIQETQRQPEGFTISAKESDRRTKLPKVDANSKVKRLADRIIYEIEAPGIHSKKDIVLTKLASGLEIKAYSKNKCYVKFIPLTVEVIRYGLMKDKLVVELKT